MAAATASTGWVLETAIKADFLRFAAGGVRGGSDFLAHAREVAGDHCGQVVHGMMLTVE